MEILIGNSKMTVYPAKVDDGTDNPIGLCFITGTLNGFHGLNHCHLQVLKSAAGFYIGAITQSNYAKDGEEPNYQWEPNFRDSQYYWATREEAETAFLSGDYEVKF